jgi:hypothetical protein
VATAAAGGFSPTVFFFNTFYFTVITAVFVWCSQPPPGLSQRINAVVRLAAGSCVAAMLFVVIFLRMVASPGFSEVLLTVSNAMAARQAGAGGYDVVQRALMAEVTPEQLLQFTRTVILQGGALIAAVLLLFASRQMSLVLARILPKGKLAGGAGNNGADFRAADGAVFHATGGADFRAAPQLIWVLSGSLFLVVVSTMANLQAPRILLWNVLALCAILYLAQGFAIVKFFLAKSVFTPLMRLLLSVSFVLLLFSPGINAVLLAGVALLGIAENWVPFRVPKSNGSPSTPEAGDDRK